MKNQDRTILLLDHIAYRRYLSARRAWMAGYEQQSWFHLLLMIEYHDEQTPFIKVGNA